MPTVKTGFWVQVVDGQVRQCWDYKPPQAKMDEEGGWQEAVEIHPDIIPEREVITNHHFDVTVSPVQIVWNKRDVSVQERVNGLRDRIKNSFQKVVESEIAKETDPWLDTHYDANVVEAARQAYLNRLSQINGLSTHDDVDNFVNSL